MLKLTVFVLSLLSVYGAEVAPSIKLNDGHQMPSVGLGTWKSGPEVYQAIIDAVEAGYRHIDTSLGYGTEKDIGKAIKQLESEGKIKRADLFITSKLEGDSHSRSKVPAAIKQSLANLQTDYLDLYLIHFPENDNTIVDTWHGMEDVHKQGLAKSIGVSNFNEKQVDMVLANGTVKPVTNQVLCHPYHNQAKLLTYLNGKGITLTAYSPLGGDGQVKTLTAEPKIVAIAKAHNVTSAQVILRYNIERNTIVIPKSITKKYILEDIDLFSFKLTAEEVKQIDSLNKN